MNLLRLRSGEFPDRAGLAMHLHLREHESGMEGSQAQGSNSNHDAVQNDKVRLILHDRVAPSIGHLTDTEDTTREDGDVCEGEAANEQPEACRVHELDSRGFELRSVRIHPQGVVADHGAEDDESDDLENDTGHHEIVADFLHVRAGIGSRCNPSASSLYDE